MTLNAIETFWTDAGAGARRFLNDRGLSEDTLRCWNVGFIARDQYDEPSAWGLTWDQADRKKIWIPRGITIPWVFQGEVWCLKVRRAREDPKYVAIKGSVTVLYGADHLHGRRTLVLAEGELDAMLAWQEAGDAVDVASLGSATKGLDPRVLPYLLPARTILASYDGDAAGREGIDRLGAVSARVRGVDLPDGQDLTDYRRAGGNLRALLGAPAREVIGPARAPDV